MELGLPFSPLCDRKATMIAQSQIGKSSHQPIRSNIRHRCGLCLSSLFNLSVSLVAGFIDFIVEPTFSVLIDTTEKVIGPLIEEDRKARETGNRRSRYYYYYYYYYCWGWTCSIIR